MPINNLAAERQARVAEVMERLTAIEATHGATRTGVDLMRDELLKLAKYKRLFVTSEFEPAIRGTFKDFVAYRLNEEDGTDRALYVSLALPGKSSPPHNHNNWAVLVGLEGVEENRLYRTDPDQGFQQIDSIEIGPGVGLALLGHEIHSIHVQGEGNTPVWQLRFYERALELQTDRVQFDESGNTTFFPPNQNTKDATVRSAEGVAQS